jgi:putative ATP-dependent endonuclease of OLD family
VILKKSPDGESSIGSSTARLELDDVTMRDLERYLDVSRGECVFARGILLVEGVAEEFLVPVLGKLLGFDFDQRGITVCSVNGTNFEPYLKLFGATGFDLPVSVLTDRDPRDDGGPPLSRQRVVSLLANTFGQVMPATLPIEELIAAAAQHGIFVNEHTLEVDLFGCGQGEVLLDTLAELTSNGAAIARALACKSDPNQFGSRKFLRDILEIGKGRYAQRLASRLTQGACPAYIRDAIEYDDSRIH